MLLFLSNSWRKFPIAKCQLRCQAGPSKANNALFQMTSFYRATSFLIHHFTLDEVRLTYFLHTLVNCPLGHFLNASSCQACAVDEYQDQEAQSSCVPCPSGTSTFGQQTSKLLQDCKGNLSITVIYWIEGAIVNLLMFSTKINIYIKLKVEVDVFCWSVCFLYGWKGIFFVNPF